MTTVLVVDDSASMRLMLSSALQAKNHEVLLAEDGQIAMDIATEQNVELVLTDINMPNMDGISLIKSLRALPQYKALVILVLTTEPEAFRNDAKTAGAAGWIAKPFDPHLLAEAVGKLTT